MKHLKTGHLILVETKNDDTGVGFVYDNGNGDLHVALSWKSGGCTNVSIEILETFDHTITIVTTFPLEIVDIEKENQSMAEHFYEMYEIENAVIDLEAIAEWHEQSVRTIIVFLSNLEDSDIARDIASGNYETFDIFDSDQFNDGYDGIISDCKLNF